jgi:hypothetical protein
MDKQETKAKKEWTSQRQILHLPLSLACPYFICLCLSFVHSSFAFVSGLSIPHLPLSQACPFFICLCLWLVHSSFAFVTGLSILHLPLSLVRPVVLFLLGIVLYVLLRYMDSDLISINSSYIILFVHVNTHCKLLYYGEDIIS